MLNSAYSTCAYKSSKKSIGALMKNPEILKLIRDHVKIKRCVKIQLKITFCNKKYS